MRRALFWLIAFLALAAGLAWLALQVPSVQDRLVDRAVASLLSGRPDGLFEEDALRVLLCGSSSPLPHRTRAGPCVAVFAAGKFFIVDVGPRSWNNLALWRVDGSRIGGVLLTHFHSDHIGELGEFNLQTWVAGRPQPLTVYGPPGVEQVVAGFSEAYALDTGYRVAHHGAELLDPEAGRMRARTLNASAEGGGPTTFYKQDGLRIKAFSVVHAPVRPAFGYRFDYGGRSVVVSGDTVSRAEVAEAARDADVLVHEAQANHIVERIATAAEAGGRPRVAKVMRDIPDYHTTPVEAAKIANASKVKLLVFYHLTPPPPLSLMEDVFVRGVTEVRPEGWLLGDDGLLVELPRDSAEVNIGQLD